MVRLIAILLVAVPTAALAEPDPILPPLRRPPSAGGWATFGGELGFFTGGAAIVLATIAALDSREELGPVVAAAGITLVTGGTVLGALGFRAWARSGHWDPHAGWGAAGVFPGMWTGLALAGGASILVDRDASTAVRSAAVAGGSALGGLAGYFAFRGMSRARGNAGWETLAFWLGFFASEVVALAITASTPEGDGGWALIATGTGACLSTAFVHLLLAQP